jgi:AcrR family transcriptional regulator
LVSATALADETVIGNLALRNEPVQARSAARLAGLLDAAAAVIDELGYERLTTAMVAERAGASIGTVYRYFPDRIAVLQALGARNLDRLLSKLTEEISAEKYENWSAALTAGLAVYEGAFKSEPGFRSLRVGDVIDLRPAPSERTNNSVVADAILAILVERFDVPNTADSRFALEAAVELSDGLAARAFSRSATGEKKFLEVAHDSVSHLLTPLFGEPR